VRAGGHSTTEEDAWPPYFLALEASTHPEPSPQQKYEVPTEVKTKDLVSEEHKK
jgi:hypothetical protein